MGLQAFERRLEKFVEGAFARAFRGGLQPVELARRLTREMDLQKAVGVRGVIAPNAFTFTLAPDDMERFSSFADTLAKELATEARDHAAARHYLFLGPVEVALEEDPGQVTGTFSVIADVAEAEGGVPTGSLLLPDGSRVELSAVTTTIGRSPDCDIVLAEDLGVSRHHAEVRLDGDSFVVADLGSRNGTKVNGAGVKERRLVSGDELVLGDTVIRFESP